MMTGIPRDKYLSINWNVDDKEKAWEKFKERMEFHFVVFRVKECEEYAHILTMADDGGPKWRTEGKWNRYR